MVTPSLTLPHPSHSLLANNSAGILLAPSYVRGGRQGDPRLPGAAPLAARERSTSAPNVSNHVDPAALGMEQLRRVYPGERGRGGEKW